MRRYEDPNPPCEVCGGPRERLISAPAVVWSKPISSYGDSSKENYRRDNANGGHWVMESRSDEALEKGGPIRRFIGSVQDQRNYCKREKLLMPSDVPNNMSISSDGRAWESHNRSEV